MSLQTKSLLYNFICFAALYTIIYFVITLYTNLTGYWVPITAAVVSSLLAPKFQAIKTRDGEKMYMKWLFIKGVKEVK